MGGPGSGGNNQKRSKEIEAKIIELVSEGMSTTNVAKEVGVGLSTLQRWRREDTIFNETYMRAQMEGFDVEADKLRDIPDEYDDVNKARLKSDNMKWLLSRLHPSRYGDRIDLNVNQTVNIRAALDAAHDRIRQVIDISSPVDKIDAGQQPVVEIGSTAKNDLDDLLK